MTSYQSFERLLVGNPPPHLFQVPWLEFEQSTALSVYEGLKDELKQLCKKPTAKRVHDTRVVLRRWDSVWKVMEADGWPTDRFNKKVGDKLRKLHRLLGKLRDWDVNLETAVTHGLTDEFLKDWNDEREKLARKVKKEVKALDVDKLLKALKRFIENRPEQMSKEFAEKGSEHVLAQSAYERLEPYLEDQERTAHTLEQNADSPEELHKLRLSIKAWRYLLAEFYGLTNLQLVKAQQILGKLNDIHRVVELLDETKDEGRDLAKNAITQLEENREKLLKEFNDFRGELPYGLRPTISSQPAE